MKTKTSRRDDPEQSKRFIDMARELEPDETGEAFDKAFKTVARPAKRPASKGASTRGKTGH